MATEDTIIKIFKMLSTAYPGSDVNQETVKLYMRLLEDIPDDVLETATLDVIGRSTFFPRISELRRASADIQTSASRIPNAYDAWQEVSQALPLYGRDHRPTFSHPLIEQTVDALGWRNLCLSVNQVSDRARFIEAYQTYHKRAQDDAVTLPQVRALAERLRMPGQPVGHLPPGDGCGERNWLESDDDGDYRRAHFQTEVMDRGESA
jgi:hypothetical protein